MPERITLSGHPPIRSPSHSARVRLQKRFQGRRKGFRSVEELREVRGIGEKKMARLRPFVTVVP
jgi:type II secretory pathway component PulK